MGKTRRKPQRRPPTDWIRSRAGGVPAKIVRTTKRDHRGAWLYRLRYSGAGLGISGTIVGSKLWTLAELEETSRFLKNKPRDWRD